jgi:predicted flap endonuclease-1-like 5' DNA nuclease
MAKDAYEKDASTGKITRVVTYDDFDAANELKVLEGEMAQCDSLIAELQQRKASVQKKADDLKALIGVGQKPEALPDGQVQ